MSDFEQLRKPPQSIEAEQAVLGGLLIDNKSFEYVLDIIAVDDFYLDSHKHIFSAILYLQKNTKPFDIITVQSWLEQNDLLDAVGNNTYIGYLVETVLTSVNIISYAEIVRDRSLLRNIISYSTDLLQSAYHPENTSVSEILDSIETKAMHIASTGRVNEKTYRKADEVTIKVTDYIEKLSTTEGNITGISTRFTKLDEMTTGLHPGELIVLAGRPSMGKTALALNIIEEVAIKNKKIVAIFSLEMPAEQLIIRMIASLGRFDFAKLRVGKISHENTQKFGKTTSQLGDSSIYIDDSPSLNPLELKSRARKIQREAKGLDLIVVDYLQLMQGSTKNDNRVAEISEISRMLKNLARELDVPVIAISQLNRSVENRPNKRPIMSDLRESGAIEQDADLILFIYRDEVYHEDSKDKGTAELIIAKQRNGPIGKVRLTFLGHYTRFENYTSIDNYQN